MAGPVLTAAPPRAEAEDLVLADLVDALLQEDIDGAARAVVTDVPPPAAGSHLGPGERWCAVPRGTGSFVFRARHGGALQPWRLSRAPVWWCGRDGAAAPVGPARLLRLLAGPNVAGARVDDLAAALDDAVEHCATILAGFRARPGRTPRPGSLGAGERLAATRNRPFHPTARAATGWTARDLARFGPMTAEPVGLAWVGVADGFLRHGPDPRSRDLPGSLLSASERDVLAEAARRAGARAGEYQQLPVHPWQYEHVLPRLFGRELRGGVLVPVSGSLGRFTPTASLRTLARDPETSCHVKLPLGVATLGATRLLPPRYLDNGDRAQRTMAELLARDARLGALAAVCDEGLWCGWRDPAADDEFDDLPGQLAAQVRHYPADLFADPGALVLPMAALAAHEGELLEPALADAGFDPADPVALFAALARPFCVLGFSFLRHGVLPELHGQNVVVQIADGAVRRFVLRDHDTLRLSPDWMRAAGVADPGYRIKPGAPQSLRLPEASALVSYLQTLGFQVNLYGIADALARRHGLAERLFWRALGEAVTEAIDLLDLPGPVADTLRATLLDAPRWPSRTVLGPLLARGRSSGVSMPAATGSVPNPLRHGAAPIGGAR